MAYKQHVAVARMKTQIQPHQCPTGLREKQQASSACIVCELKQLRHVNFELECATRLLTQLQSLKGSSTLTSNEPGACHDARNNGKVVQAAAF